MEVRLQQVFMSEHLSLQSLQRQRQTSFLHLVRACYSSTFLPTHLDNFIPCKRTRIDCLRLYSPAFLFKWSGKPRRHKDARRHLCFTLTLQTLSSLQHLLAYGCDYHNLSTSSNLFSFFKCSLLPGVELNACASIDIMSPLSPCTNRVSNTLTVYATRTRCSDKIRTLHLRLHTVVHLTMNICVHVLNGAYFTACT